MVAICNSYLCKLCFVFDLNKNLTLKKDNLFSFSLLNRFFALSSQRIIKERTKMNTLTIDQAVYDGAALYARQNNMSIQKVIELGVKLLLDNVRHSNTKTNDMELEQALKYVSTLSAKGGRTVPMDENGRDARIEKYIL